MDKFERVARALCSAEGRDPDEPVETGERLWRGFQGTIPVTEPQWHRYRNQARGFVAAFEAMQTNESAAASAGLDL